MASAVHIMSYLAYKGDATSTSDAIAHSLATNPVVVRKLLKMLETEGLVVLRQGRSGGVALARAPAEIRLDQIYNAIKGDGSVFGFRETVNPRCVIAKNMPNALGPIFAAADNAVMAALQTQTLEHVMSELV